MSYVYTKNKLELIDGSLTPVATVPADMVLVIERALTGPTDQLYLVQDMAEAKNLYGDKSPIVNLASRTLLGRAENVALYRIGGQAFSYDNIFGPQSTLRLSEASATAADNIKVYVGPEPKNETRDCIIIYKNDRIIYSNVIGGEINSSQVIVSGFQKTNNTVNIGTLDNPVPFDSLLEAMGGSAMTTATPSLADVDGEPWYQIPLTEITGFVAGTDKVENISLKDDTDTVVPYTVSTDGNVLKIVTFAEADASGVVPGQVTASFLKTMSGSELTQNEITYTPGKDTMNSTYKELYEELDKALERLELLPTKAVVTGDWFNIPSIANGDTGDNVLEYLIKGEDDLGYPTYDWSRVKYIYSKQVPEGAEPETTTDITEAELNVNNEPVVIKEYNEVDFTHRIGMFAYNNLEEGDFLNVVIGAKGPLFTNPKSINDWVGKEPIRDLSGNIVENGTGLLGHRLMVGSTTYRGGYFATANGFVDGDIIVDRTGFPVDLGKHLSIVVSQVAGASKPIFVTSAAAAYAGLISILPPGDSTTNAKLDNLISVFNIKEVKRKALAKNGYVVTVDKSTGLTVYSGDLATRENSDYAYVSTANSIAAISKLIKRTVDPYLGKGSDYTLIIALNTELTTVLGDAQRMGWMNSYTFRIRKDGPNSLIIPFKIEAKDELREVNSLVRLSRPNT